ncbi:aromatic compound dioxygenase [Armillaria solidipes]|uniref:Aromatic compound dioxygenase n=1 Tax=Armillaria solidipes TaxID=1076256 RepID=A0A2H3ARR5_9AGAR|nr:aromatic compound dioxygenase [Armillaria solidipes]
MRSVFTLATLALSLLSSTSAHPHKASSTVPAVKRRGVGNCADSISRRASGLADARRRSLQRRLSEDTTRLAARGLEERAKYPTIQNDTCVLSPDTIFGPYFVDGELYRRDIREGAEGIDLYLDIGLIDVDTCEPIEGAYIDFWHCNADGIYSGYTGINPDTVEPFDGVTLRADGTTDDTTFLRGFTATDENGIAEFLTIFPGYYASRTTHIHIAVHVNGSVSEDGTNTLATSNIQHVGQLFFEESLINQVYEIEAYTAHLSTLDRVTNDADTIIGGANSDGYSAFVSTELLGDSLEDGLVGYITVGVDTTAIFDTSNSNPVGVIPTVSLAEGAEASASAVDASEGLTV